jgi:hypothetical protein
MFGNSCLTNDYPHLWLKIRAFRHTYKEETFPIYDFASELIKKFYLQYDEIVSYFFFFFLLTCFAKS